MKVGVFLTKLETFYGGAFTLQETIVNDLLKVKSKHEFTVFYRGQMNFIKDTPVKFVPLDTFAGSKPLAGALSEHQIDIVWFPHVTTYEKVEIPFIIPVLDLQHRLQPFFPEVSISGWDWDSREAFYSDVLPRASYILAATDAGRNEIAQFYQIPYERIKKIPRPVSSFALEYSKKPKSELSKIDEFLSSRYSALFKDNKTFLFYPAQFWPHKNHIGILLAVKILQEKYSLDFSVVFTGSDHGNKKYIQEKVSDLGLTNNAFFLGLVSFDVLARLYQKAFALIYPTFFGPDNLPPLEAFALGCPVIASDVAGAQEQLGDAAILINPKKEDDIAAAIKKLHDEPDLRQTFIKRGYDKVRELQKNNYVENIISIFDEFEPVRRCWSNKEIYKYIVQDGTIEEADSQVYGSDNASKIAEGKEIENINGLLESGKFKEADSVLEHAIEKYPNSIDLLNLQAMIKIYMGDKEGAKVILFDLIGRWPTQYAAYNNLAIIFWESGDFDNAMKYFEETLKVSNYNRAAVFAYGEMLTSLKKFARAKELFGTYLKNNPDDKEVQRLLEKAKGNLDGAMKLSQAAERII